MTKDEYFHRLILFLAISILLHLGAYKGLEWGLSGQQFHKNSAPIEMVLFEAKPEQTFVTDPEVGRVLDKLNRHAKYLSKLTRRVKKQKVARESGKTVNRQQANPKEIETKIKKKAKFDPLIGLPSFSPREIEPYPRQARRSALPSTIAEYIPNVAQGSITALNTDQFSYYAFFNRINEQIRLRWTTNIRNLSLSLPPEIINHYALIPRQTELELVVDKEGEFQNIFVDKSSGAPQLDMAAKEAFIDAAPYLNPPSDLVDDDGFIRMKYSVRVVWKPRFIARDKGPGN